MIDAVRISWLSSERSSIELAREIASLHAEVLPEDLTAALGSRVRVSVFFNLMQSSDCIVAIHKEKVVGFCVMSKGSAVNRAFMADPFGLALGLVRMLFVSPGRFVEFFHAVLMSYFKRTSRFQFAAEIFSFAVSANMRSQGLGARIVSLAFEKHKYGRILTKTSSPRARDFYLNNGFDVIGRERRGRRIFDILLSRESCK